MVMMMEQLSKTKMCKFYQRGLCTKGTQCPFAHDAKELQPLPDLSRSKFCMVLRKTGRCDNPKCSYAHKEAELQTSGTFYKTKVCKYWQSGGKCPLGQACSFAHSQIELRSELRPAGSRDETESTSASSNGHKEDILPESNTDISSEPACIDVSSLKTAFSADSEPAHIDLLSMFSYTASDGLDYSKESGYPAPSSETWKAWSKADIAACPEFVPLKPASSGWPLLLPPGLANTHNPWILPCDESAKSENFGGKTDAIRTSYSNLWNFSGEVYEPLDECSKLSKVKKDRMITVADMYQAKQKYPVTDPGKVSVPCVRF
jgi:hypothetical protein